MPLNSPYDVLNARRQALSGQPDGQQPDPSPAPDQSDFTGNPTAFQVQRAQGDQAGQQLMARQAASDKLQQAAMLKQQQQEQRQDQANAATEARVAATNNKSNGVVTQTQAVPGPGGKEVATEVPQQNDDGTTAYNPADLGIQRDNAGNAYKVTRNKWGAQEWSDPYSPANANISVNSAGSMMATPKGKGAAALPAQDVSNTQPPTPEVLAQLGQREQKIVGTAAAQHVKDTVVPAADQAAADFSDARQAHQDALESVRLAKANQLTDPDSYAKATQEEQGTRQALVDAAKKNNSMRQQKLDALADPMKYIQDNHIPDASTQPGSPASPSPAQVGESQALQAETDAEKASGTYNAPGAQKKTDEPVTPPSPDSYDSNFNTKLSPDQQSAFQAWKAKYAPNDDGSDYDLQGAFLAGVKPDPGRGHFPDTFKKPNHPTFSDQSQYSGVDDGKGGTLQGGKWGDDNSFTPSATNLQTHSAGDLANYFQKVEPDSKLNLPQSSPSSPTPAPADGSPQANPDAQQPTGTIQDAIDRIDKGIGTGVGQAITSLGRLNQDLKVVNPEYWMDKLSDGIFGTNKVGQMNSEFQHAIDVGKTVESNAQNYATDPTKDNTFTARGSNFIGGMLPFLASGPAAPITAGLTLKESGREIAKDKGASDTTSEAASVPIGLIGGAAQAFLGPYAGKLLNRVVGSSTAPFSRIILTPLLKSPAAADSLAKGAYNFLLGSAQKGFRTAADLALQNGAISAITNWAGQASGGDPSKQTSPLHDIFDQFTDNVIFGAALHAPEQIVNETNNAMVKQAVRAAGAKAQFIRQTSNAFGAIDASPMTMEQKSAAKDQSLHFLSPDVKTEVMAHVDNVANAQAKMGTALTQANAALSAFPKPDPQMAGLSDNDLHSQAVEQADKIDSKTPDANPDLLKQLQDEQDRRAKINQLQKQTQQTMSDAASRMMDASVATNDLAKTPEGRSNLRALTEFNTKQDPGTPRADAITAKQASDMAPGTPEGNSTPLAPHYIPIAHDINQLTDPDQQTMARAAVKLANGRALNSDEINLAFGNKTTGQPPAVDATTGKPLVTGDPKVPILTDAGLARLKTLVPSAEDILPKSEQAQREAAQNAPKPNAQGKQKVVTEDQTPPFVAPSQPHPELASLNDETLHVRYSNLLEAISKSKDEGRSIPEAANHQLGTLQGEINRRQHEAVPAQPGQEIQYAHEDTEAGHQIRTGEVVNIEPEKGIYHVVDVHDGSERRVPFHKAIIPDQAAGGGGEGEKKTSAETKKVSEPPALPKPKKGAPTVPGIDPAEFSQHPEIILVLAEAHAKMADVFKRLGMDPNAMYRVRPLQRNTFGLAVHPMQPGRFLIDPKTMARSLDMLPSPEAKVERVIAALQEEGIHTAGEQVAEEMANKRGIDKEQIFDEIRHEMTEDQVEEVRSEYGEEAFDAMPPAYQAREYIRMRVQLELDGRHTEVAGQMSGKLKAYFQAVIDHLKTVFSGGNEQVNDMVRSIQTMINGEDAPQSVPRGTQKHPNLPGGETLGMPLFDQPPSRRPEGTPEAPLLETAPKSMNKVHQLLSKRLDGWTPDPELEGKSDKQLQTEKDKIKVKLAKAGDSAKLEDQKRFGHLTDELWYRDQARRLDETSQATGSQTPLTTDEIQTTLENHHETESARGQNPDQPNNRRLPAEAGGSSSLGENREEPESLEQSDANGTIRGRNTSQDQVPAESSGEVRPSGREDGATSSSEASSLQVSDERTAGSESGTGEPESRGTGEHQPVEPGRERKLPEANPTETSRFGTSRALEGIAADKAFPKKSARFYSQDGANAHITKSPMGKFRVSYFDTSADKPWKVTTHATLDSAVKALTGRGYFYHGKVDEALIKRLAGMTPPETSITVQNEHEVSEDQLHVALAALTDQGKSAQASAVERELRAREGEREESKNRQQMLEEAHENLGPSISEAVSTMGGLPKPGTPKAEGGLGGGGEYQRLYDAWRYLKNKPEKNWFEKRLAKLKLFTDNPKWSAGDILDKHLVAAGFDGAHDAIQNLTDELESGHPRYPDRPLAAAAVNPARSPGYEAALDYLQSRSELSKLDRPVTALKKSLDGLIQKGRDLFNASGIREKANWVKSVGTGFDNWLANAGIPRDQQAGLRHTLFDYVARGDKDGHSLARFTDDMLSNVRPAVKPESNPARVKEGRIVRPVPSEEQAWVNDLIAQARQHLGQQRFNFVDTKGNQAQVYTSNDGSTSVRIPGANDVGGDFQDIKSAVEHLVDKGFELQSSALEKKLQRTASINRFMAMVNAGLKMGQKRFHFEHEDGRTAALISRKDGGFTVSGLSDLHRFDTAQAATTFLQDRGFGMMTSGLEKNLRDKGLHPDQANEPIPYSDRQREVINQYRRARGETEMPGAESPVAASAVRDYSPDYDTRGTRPTTADLEGRARQGSPGATADLLRRRIGADEEEPGEGLQGDSRVQPEQVGDHSTRDTQSREYLKLAEDLGKVLPAYFLQHGKPLTAQGEHEVYTHGDRVYKITQDHEDFDYGTGLDQDYQTTPYQYLNRFALANRVFGDDIKWEGVIPSDGHIRTVTSQPFYSGEHPTLADILTKLKGMGFKYHEVPSELYGMEPTKIWYRPSDGVILGDVKPANFIKADDGSIRPIDVIAEKATNDQLEKYGLLGKTAIASSAVDTRAFKNWFGDYKNDPDNSSKVVDAEGNPKVVYHGTSRADRVGNRFRKSRATSGPMAFFTDSKEIANSYSTKKLDTSLEQPSDYRDWFKMKPIGSRGEVNLQQAWHYLTPEERSMVIQRLFTTGYSDPELGEGSIVGTSKSIMDNNGIRHYLQEAKGNGLEAAKEIWLNSGALFGREKEFEDVLKGMGIGDRFRYDDPWSTNPKTYATYLNIRKPLETSSIPDEVLNALQKRANGQRKVPAVYGADAWDKNTRDAKDWMSALKTDLTNKENSHVWTSIPDWVTDTLHKFGYDGIHDTGGKNGGIGHDVWIPFEDRQIKSATDNRGTFDPTKANILHASAVRDEDDDRPPIVQASRKINKLVDGFKNGQLNHDEFHQGLSDLANQMAEVSRYKQSKEFIRQRGPDIVREKLLNARRRSFIPHDQAEFALWALNQNPHLAHDLSMSVRSATEGSVAGQYEPVSRIVTLFKGNQNPDTAVHEILHHAERMMPDTMQADITKEWSNAWGRAFSDASDRNAAKEQRALLNILWSQNDDRKIPTFDSEDGKPNDKTAAKLVRDSFVKGDLNYAHHYQLVNPSEYWAVNGSRIMNDRYASQHSWAARAKQWMNEMVQKAKGLLGVPSDSPILAGLHAVINGNGENVAPNMITSAKQYLSRSAKPSDSTPNLFGDAIDKTEKTPEVETMSIMGAKRVYQQLDDRRKSGKSLSPEQSNLLERAEKVLGQKMMDLTVQPGDVAEKWINAQFPIASKTGLGKSSEDSALKVISEWIRKGETPSGKISPDIQDALMRSLKPTRDMETGELLDESHPDWPRTGTLLDFLENRHQDRVTQSETSTDDRPYTVNLNSVAGKANATARTLQEAANMVHEFRDSTGMASSHMDTGFGDVTKDGQKVVSVSYNGRVWNPDGTEYAGKEYPSNYSAWSTPDLEKRLHEVMDDPRANTSEVTKGIQAMQNELARRQSEKDAGTPARENTSDKWNALRTKLDKQNAFGDKEVRTAPKDIFEDKKPGQQTMFAGPVRDWNERIAIPEKMLGFPVRKMVGHLPADVHTAAELMRDSRDDITKWWAPQLRTDEAGKTGRIIRANLSEIARNRDQAEQALKSARAFFDTKPLDYIHDVIKHIENNTRHPDPQVNEIVTTLRGINNKYRDLVRSMPNTHFKNFIEHYFPHIWAKTDLDKATKFYQRKIEGSTAFLKHRSIPTIEEGLQYGLHLASDNPVDLFLLRWNQMDKYVAGQRILQDMKDSGLAMKFRSDGEAPEGWKRIDDRIGLSTEDVPVEKEVKTPYLAHDDDEIPGLQGPGRMEMRTERRTVMERQLQRYYAPESAVQILDNHLSSGLRDHAAYKVISGVANTMNQAQLGLSAFHAGFTTFDAAVSRLAVGIEHLASHDFAEGAKTIASVPWSPITNLLQGNKLLKEWDRPGSQGEEAARIVNAMIQAGARVREPQEFTNHMWKAFRKNWAQGNKFAAAWRFPLGVVEKVASPIMAHLVPRQKLGVFADMARREISRLGPNATQDEFRGAVQKAWDSVDNRLGQLVYDNLFWNKTAKDMAMITTRSVGWNLGSFRELLGGLHDWGSASKAALTGNRKQFEFTHRMAYTMALPILTGTVGAILQRLYTGEDPKELRDYFFPKTGEKDGQGHNIRLALPTYMKDVYGFAHQPVQTLVNKSNPILSMLGDMYSNRDFWGQEIRNPDDNAFQQAAELMGFTMKSFAPFAATGAMRLHDQGASPSKLVLPFVGITPAAAYIDKSPAELKAEDLYRDTLPAGARTSEEMAKSNSRGLLMNKLRKVDPIDGKTPEDRLDRSRKMGDLLRMAIADKTIQPKDVNTMIRDMRFTPLQRQFHRLGYEAAVKVWELATPAQKQEIKPMFTLKMQNAMKDGKDVDLKLLNN